MLLFGFATLILATTSCAQAASVSFNEHIEQYALERGIGVDVVLGVAHNESEGVRPLVRRAPDWPTRHPELKAIIDRAVKKTAARTHYFWSGRVLPATSNDDSVIDRALKLAQSKGGTVLEATMDDVPMPDYAGGDPDAEDIWQYASDAYAAESRGDVYVVKGESLRPGNVWEVYEYPRLKKMSAVKRIFEIKYRRAGPDAPRQIWPELQGCDGVKFLEKEVTCPAGAKMYYGSPKKPVVTAKTTVAKDTKMKVSATGNAPGVVRECTEIMSVEWIMELFEKSGVCEAATAKGDGGKTMTKVKALLTSSNNRNYIQRERLLKMKAKVIGLPIMGALKWMLIDSLVSIDYYEQTAAATASMTRQIDSMVLAATGKSPGLVAAWNAKISTQKGTKAALLLELQKEIAQKAKEAKEAAARKGACGAPATPGKGTTPTTPSKPARMIRRWSTTSPATLSSLESRAQTARRSGPKAAAAPSCPLKTAPQKKVVPRSKAKTKAPPAKTPRVPAKQPARLPPKRTKKVAPRPANRARRTPGKASPPKRTTPKRKPKAVPKPTRRPKGRPRARKGRRK